MCRVDNRTNQTSSILILKVSKFRINFLRIK
nr:MAG TPA: hypothetical protein [Bacteriophage sp.]